MGLFKSFFTWWDGPTWGARLWTRRAGEDVGEDAQGNRYYRARGRPGMREKRWVIYKGENEASRVPPEWHGWLHRTTDVLPEKSQIARKAWQRPHEPNATGTAAAWKRPGVITSPQPRAGATGDYEAWTPEAKPPTNRGE